MAQKCPKTVANQLDNGGMNDWDEKEDNSDKNKIKMK